MTGAVIGLWVVTVAVAAVCGWQIGKWERECVECLRRRVHRTREAEHFYRWERQMKGLR